MKKVFVVGALLPTGGAYMAYHLGRLLHRHFGYQLFDVAVYKAENQLFRYDTPIRTVRAAQMEKMIGPDDLLVVNPAFSGFLFGWRLPGRKIMYIQDFRTFLLLDCHCDLYVSVSDLVKNYVKALYAIDTPVIPAFIQLNKMPETKPWRERPRGSALVYMKNPSPEHRVLLHELTARVSAINPAIDLSRVLEGRNLTHGEFLHALGNVRYLVNLSLAEGFGLVPLEAMALGTMVTGVDGLGGRDYLKPGENCLTASITDLNPLAETVARAFADETLAEACAAAGRQTAQGYGHGPFKSAWLKQFSAFLGEAPRHA